MRNGQLKPGYNVNVATASEYIICSYVSADRTNTKTLIPFAKQLSCYSVERFIVDAGYESEENYCYFEQPWISAKLLVKPANHEQKKRKKYRTDISRRENMAYDPQTDTYTCANGKRLEFDHIRKTKSSAGFPIETSVYKCAEWAILTMEYNILKLYHKIQTGRLGTHLAVPTSFLQSS